MEIWKDIDNYVGLYQVSNLGNVKRTFVLKQAKDKSGYLNVNLSKNGKYKRFRVHRLVAQAFIVNENNFDEVNHKNGNKLDNRVDNLEWTNHYQNMKHARENNLISKSGIDRSIKSMNEKTRKQIFQLYNGIIVGTYIGINQASKETNICASHICDVLKGKRIKAGGFSWKYK